MAKKTRDIPSLESLTRSLAAARAGSELAECWNAADEVFEVLEATNRNPGFEGGWEIWDMLERPYYYPSRIEDPDALGTVEELYPVIAEMLRGPLASFRFKVPLGEENWVCNAHELGFDIGGVHQLALVPPENMERSQISHLVGEVCAATIGGAIAKTERILDEALGMMRALGFVELAPAFKMPYVKLATARLWNERITSPDGEDFALSSEYATLLRAVRFEIPRDISDLETASIKTKPVDESLSRYIRTVRKILGSQSPRALELRNACRIAFTAERTRDVGFAISLGFTCLEAILIGSKDGDIGAKLREAVAYSLGRTSDERQQLRDDVKSLYEIRSQFVHQGKSREGSRARLQVLDLMFRVLRREFECLPTPDTGPA